MCTVGLSILCHGQALLITIAGVQPAPLDLAKEATTRDVQLQLDSPYEGPLPSEDRRAIMKASLCPESPFAAYTMYAGSLSWGILQPSQAEL